MGKEGRRTESDSLGEIEVTADRYWGAQTQRSLENLAIGGQRFPPACVHAFNIVKKAVALTNGALSKLDKEGEDAIVSAPPARVSRRCAYHTP